ncbi:Gfo/Idh/MocA family protein [Halosegnis marinus]|uniref:Gfo/Idh/MocA family protein n=1 Tax=Halosegnis marinus TaxID=3034023 RepID=A0ABD5ZMI5_9EURY|nr:Gfo/Idh/MocA family oxidoreductase [Halosegnis sp. DT85]
MYDVGLVGCGVIGTRLAETFAAHDATRVAAACDRDPDRADGFAADYDCAAYTDHAAMFADADLDIAYVGVPPVAHREVATDALDAGLHTICEKPLAPDADEGESLVAAAEASDCVTAVNLPFRYTEGFVELRERVGAGDVGDPRRVELDFRFPRWPREWQDVGWLRGREQGGPVREVGTHFLFGVQELFGPVERVAAEVEYSGPDTYEESVVATFEAGGVAGTFDLLCDCDVPEENVIEVTGTEGSLALTDWYRLVADRGTDDERVLVDERSSTTAALVEAFVAEIEGEGGDLVSFREANRVQRVVDAILAGEGRSVAVEGGAD